MNVDELLNYQPEKPSVSAASTLTNKRTTDAAAAISAGYPKRAKRPILDDVPMPSNGPSISTANLAALSSSERDKLLQMLEQESSTEELDETSLKRMLSQLEKRISKNQEMRIKYPDHPEKFMESEIELNDAVQELHVIATQSDFYHVLVNMNGINLLMGLLTHENTDISIAVISLIQELTDVDTLTESEQQATFLIDALAEQQIVSLLVQNMDRLDENVKEEADGIHNSLAIVENMTEFRPTLCVDACKQGLLTCLLKRLKIKSPFGSIRLYCSELMSILLQNHDENRQMLGELEGIDILLQQLAYYKRHDPQTSEEFEYMENLFSCLCSSLMFAPNRQRFLKGEGPHLMNIMLKERKTSRIGALRTLDFAMTGIEGKENCQKIVDILGLRAIFPLFMKPPKGNKRSGETRAENEEHVISCIASLVRNCTGSNRQRVLNKFTENDHEKVDRLMELHFQYFERIQSANNNLEDDDDEDVDEAYLRRLDAGLFTLQLIDYIIIEIASSTTNIPSIRQRIMQILNLRNTSTDSIKTIIREYANNLGTTKKSNGVDHSSIDGTTNGNNDDSHKRHLLDLIEEF
jgi:beta-catenin-like protein 1